MSGPHILRRYRVAALLGAALIVSPFVFSALRANYAVAATAAPYVAGLAGPNRSLALDLAADKPAVVMVTSVTRAQPDEAGETASPFDEYLHLSSGHRRPPAPRRGHRNRLPAQRRSVQASSLTPTVRSSPTITSSTGLCRSR